MHRHCPLQYGDNYLATNPIAPPYTPTPHSLFSREPAALEPGIQEDPAARFGGNRPCNSQSILARIAPSLLARIVPHNVCVGERIVVLRGGGERAQTLNDDACRRMASGGEADVYQTEDSLQQARALQPNNAAALCNYGRLLLRQDRNLALAGDMMAKAVRLQPAPAIFSS